MLQVVPACWRGYMRKQAWGRTGLTPAATFLPPGLLKILPGCGLKGLSIRSSWTCGTLARTFSGLTAHTVVHGRVGSI